MSMGFSEGEARLGLRACDGNVQNAVAHIIKRREVSMLVKFMCEENFEMQLQLYCYIHSKIFNRSIWKGKPEQTL